MTDYIRPTESERKHYCIKLWQLLDEVDNMTEQVRPQFSRTHPLRSGVYEIGAAIHALQWQWQSAACNVPHVDFIDKEKRRQYERELKSDDESLALS